MINSKLASTLLAILLFTARPGYCDHTRAAAQTLSPIDRDALSRLAFAEAGNQGEDGLAAVIYTVLNRLNLGRWGRSITDVENYPGQFEPVMSAGGHWQDLPTLEPGEYIEANTIIDLIIERRLPDPTNGALYFQNPTIVAKRAAAGLVDPHLVNFGNTTPVAVIGDHSFYTTTQTPMRDIDSINSNPPETVFAPPAPPTLFAPLQGAGATPPGLFVPVSTTPAALRDSAITSLPSGIGVPISQTNLVPTPSVLPPSPGAIDPNTK